MDLGVLSGYSRNIMVAIDFCLIWQKFFGIFFSSLHGKYRKISYFADKEGKVRLIGILDYFSQTVLIGLHKYLYRVLKKIPQDFTFDQGSFRSHIKDWDVFYSIDLSSATDRFPIKVISQVLRGILPDFFCDAWERVMSGHPFAIKLNNQIQ